MNAGEIRASAVIAEWQDAYQAANGRPAPKVEYSNGWLTVGYNKARVREMQEWTVVLRRRVEKSTPPEAKP